jgi:hypothetical protein
VQDQLSDNFPPGAPSVVPGDTATNQAAVSGSLLNVTNLTTPTGSTQDDDTHLTGTVAQTTFTKTVYAITATPIFRPFWGPMENLMHGLETP